MLDLDRFISEQLSVWPLAAENFHSLSAAKTQTLNIKGLDVILQHNPCRIISTTARVDPASIAGRACFLCEATRPREQFHLGYVAPSGSEYHIQVNPYPIFPGHLVVAREEHVPQLFIPAIGDFLSLARECDDYVFFYNGPMSGASAPDHMHFQGTPKGLMPLQKDVDKCLSEGSLDKICEEGTAALYHYEKFCSGIFVIEAQTSSPVGLLTRKLLSKALCYPGEPEPRINAYCWHSEASYRLVLIFRHLRSPHHFSLPQPQRITMSPGAADMAGFMVVPLAEDFSKLGQQVLSEMVSECVISEDAQNLLINRMRRPQKIIKVGVLSASQITFTMSSEGGDARIAAFEGGKVRLGGKLSDELYFPDGPFTLEDVVIGVDFHWQRSRTLSYEGALRIIAEGDKLTAVNEIGIEDYLLSVISSEMKPSASLEFLKSHAIISRSWLLTNLATHEHFDVCADDHCQRYQGLSMVAGDRVLRAINETWGEVLKYEGNVCDARYSKCCGGMSELYSTCWEDKDYDYLQALPDAAQAGGKAFCDTSDEKILAEVLNDYDLETKDFFNWEQRYAPDELAGLIERRTGEQLGEIIALVPLERGRSGRISKLRIEGKEGSIEIGKELAIRRALSESHLKSSAFEVSREGDLFVLKGRGWGHGVGLCQIGAAVMASEGFDHEAILSHYYPGAKIEKI